MGVKHFLAHLQDAATQLRLLPVGTQHFDAQLLESAADGSVAGDCACPRQRLVLPQPGLLQLVALHGVERGHQQAADAVRAKPQVGFIQNAGRGDAGQPVVDALG